VQTAKNHNVSTLSLADALVAIAQTQSCHGIDDAAFAVARATWGDLVDQTPQRRAVSPSPPQCDHENDDEAVSGA
jgi:hypothetical protein